MAGLGIISESFIDHDFWASLPGKFRSFKHYAKKEEKRPKVTSYLYILVNYCSNADQLKNPPVMISYLNTISLSDRKLIRQLLQLRVRPKG